MNTNLLRIFSFLFTLLSAINSLNAQQSEASFNTIQNQRVVVPPSPNAATLGEYGKYDVSHYTGAVNLSLIHI